MGISRRDSYPPVLTEFYPEKPANVAARALWQEVNGGLALVFDTDLDWVHANTPSSASDWYLAQAAGWLTNDGASAKIVRGPSGSWASESAGGAHMHVHGTHGRGLLSEPLRENLCLHGTPDANWVERGTGTITGGQADPLGGTDAALLTGLGAITVDDVYDTFVGFTSAETRYEVGFFAKQSSTSGVVAVWNAQSGNTNGEWDLDLSLLSSEWEWVDRNHPAVTITAEFKTPTAVTTGGIHFFKSSGTGALALYVAFCQAEEGTIPTSPIATSGAAVTRAADDLFNASEVFPVGSVMSMLVDFVPLAVYTGTVLSLGDAADQIAILDDGGGNVRVTMTLGSGANNLDLAAVAASRTRIALRFEDDNLAASMNGAAIVADTTTNTPGTPDAKVYLSALGTPSATVPILWRRIVVVPRAWTNAELVALSAVP